MSLIRLLVLSLVSVLILAGCGRTDRATIAGDTAADAGAPADVTLSSSLDANSAGAVSPAEAVDNTLLLQELEAAVQKWESHGITRYSLRVRHSQPTWNIQIIDVTVADGVVVESKQNCYPERNCILKKIEPQDFTVEALFEVARRVASLGDGPIEITFTETYGYPNAIAYEDGFWNLEAFKPLEPAP